MKFPDPRTYDYSNPSHYCDIVMKGGITSGVVYPHAVCELAQTYRFRNVGGTSAGAIAAAATAAAERGRATGGFSELADLPHWIRQEENLKDLFQPQRSTRRLFKVLLAAIDGGRFRTIGSAVFWYFPQALLGAVPGAALIALAGNEGSGALQIWAIMAGVALSLIGSTLAIAAGLVRQVMRAIPENGYGLCSGWESPERCKTEPLTTWLSRLLNQYAAPLSHDGPLTFGDLWAGPNREEPPEDPAERDVQLEMMTTNLTNHRAHRLPWESKPRHWFFNPDEFRKLFPESVVAWMEEHPPPEPETSSDRQDWRMRQALLHPLRPLPAARDLPVIVATRMSLSFPVLLSAIPLWRIDMSLEANGVLHQWEKWAQKQGNDWNPIEVPRDEWPATGQPDKCPSPEACWFSDGGISSNFPVHFFDRFVPRWPTFAINLRGFHPDHQESESNQMENTWMVLDNKHGQLDWWYRWPKRRWLWWKDRQLSGFFSAVMKTMQNRVDDSLLPVPGYRDRIVHVSMTKEQGGMNLTMPGPVIDKLTERGRCAGARLVEVYTRPPDSNEVITWDNHRWIRLRSTLAALEEMNERIARGYEKRPATRGERTYAQLLERGKDDPPSSYRMTAGQRKLAGLQAASVIAMHEATDTSDQSLRTETPHPVPEARILPLD